MASGMGLSSSSMAMGEGSFCSRPDEVRVAAARPARVTKEAAIASDAMIVVICLDVRLTNLVFIGRASRALWLPSWTQLYARLGGGY